MKFCEKLQMLRKEKGYSQEQLADLLDVSRQAVSKWESGLTYPEMDKLLTLCKIFNVSLDDLTNDEISKTNLREHKKNNFSNLVYTIIDMFEKSIEMFKQMNKKALGKMLLELVILIIILVICKMPFNYLEYLIRNLFTSLNIRYAFYSICSFIINLIYFVFFVCILIYFYKTRYLDREIPEIEKKPLNIQNEAKVPEKKKVEAKEKKATIEERKFILFDLFGNLLNICLKIILFFTLLGLCFCFVTFVFFLVLTIILALQKIFSLGLILMAMALVIGTGVILNLNIAWLFNHENNYKMLLINFLTSLVLLASGGAIFSFELTHYNFLNEAPQNVTYAHKSYTFPMQDNTFLVDAFPDSYHYLTYKVNDELKTEIKYDIYYYSDFQNIEVRENANNAIALNLSANSINFPIKKFSMMIIENLQAKTLYNYDHLYDVNIVVETSQDNIDILKQNYLAYEEEYRQKEMDYWAEEYEKQIEDLEEENYSLRDQRAECELKISDLQDKINELEEKLADYKARVEDLLN